MRKKQRLKLRLGESAWLAKNAVSTNCVTPTVPALGIRRAATMAVPFGRIVPVAGKLKVRVAPVGVRSSRRQRCNEKACVGCRL